MRCCATPLAMAKPWSSSIKANARSMPAVMPADVHTLPSRQKMRSASTRMDGYSRDRKSTRLNSSHGYISYAVFCLKKKKKKYVIALKVSDDRIVHTVSADAQRRHHYDEQWTAH